MTAASSSQCCRWCTSAAPTRLAAPMARTARRRAAEAAGGRAAQQDKPAARCAPAVAAAKPASALRLPRRCRCLSALPLPQAVTQRPPKYRLELFQTGRCGWGVRTLVRLCCGAGHGAVGQGWPRVTQLWADNCAVRLHGAPAPRALSCASLRRLLAAPPWWYRPAGPDPAQRLCVPVRGRGALRRGARAPGAALSPRGGRFPTGRPRAARGRGCYCRRPGGRLSSSRSRARRCRRCRAALQVRTVEEVDAEYAFDMVPRPDTDWTGAEVPPEQQQPCAGRGSGRGLPPAPRGLGARRCCSLRGGARPLRCRPLRCRPLRCRCAGLPPPLPRAPAARPWPLCAAAA